MLDWVSWRAGWDRTHSEVVVAVVGHDGNDLILIPEGSDDLRDIWAASESSESSEHRTRGSLSALCSRSGKI